MLVEADVTRNATMEIIKDTGERLTISIPHGLLPVNLIVDPPGAARLVQLLADYAERAKPTGLVNRENPSSPQKECDTSSHDDVTPTRSARAMKRTGGREA
jgi:hypothetical protein